MAHAIFETYNTNNKQTKKNQYSLCSRDSTLTQRPVVSFAKSGPHPQIWPAQFLQPTKLSDCPPGDTW